MNVIKTVRYIVGSLAGLSMAVFALPKMAFAASGSWSPSDIIDGDQVDPMAIDANVISEWVRTFTTWAVGIAIVLFVLRIVITAVDRMLFQSGGGTTDTRGLQNKQSSGEGGSPLSSLPTIIRPYTGNWKEIFKTFALQLAVCAGAWLIVNILSGVILWAFSSLLNA